MMVINSREDGGPIPECPEALPLLPRHGKGFEIIDPDHSHLVDSTPIVSYLTVKLPRDVWFLNLSRANGRARF
jgi:hypothetical protein